MATHDARNIDPLTNTPTMGAAMASAPAATVAGFAPGAIIAGRYRLVSLVGRGGMGEVYRADDLTLDQTVALKFLPAGIAASDTRLAQFHNELRVARQVSHKNVCRLHDLGEAEGRRFLTMEYVDGEDLASTLRRFGRLLPDKAVQIARQLCAGVAAAHERGVLHRDLKPANVMLDGHGDVRITDFGIATAAADTGAETAGTPEYMAPELLAGKPASIQSDIYALGLILFEVFTGTRAFEAKSIAELRQLHETHTLTPSAIVRDLDPAVERVILRCLEKDPKKRPPSALTVAASLPGADPLAAALAAGETPSPELLVAAGESDAMPVARALALAVSFIIVLALSIGLISRGSAAGVTGMPIAREALADRAEQLLRKLGYTEPIVHRAMGLGVDGDYLRWAQAHGSNNWWDELRNQRPAPITFWYRTSPTPLVSTNAFTGRVEKDDPPLTVPGMRQVLLDAYGRLVELRVVPPQTVPSGDAAPPRWESLFEAANLDARQFTATSPRWTPTNFADATAAWEGQLPGRTTERLRVEAAAFRGRIVSLRMLWPWIEPAHLESSKRSSIEKAVDGLNISFWIVMIAGGVLLARHNLRTQRADRRGAARFGIVILLATLAARLASASHTSDPRAEMSLNVIAGLALAALSGGLLWIYYLAVEPYGRRYWPDALLAWTRLWSGRLRDPRVGREMLIGIACGGLALIAVEVPKVLVGTFGWQAPQFPFGNALWVVEGTPSLMAYWLGQISNALQNALYIAMLFLVLRLLLRRPRLAMAAGIGILLLILNNGQIVTGTWIDRFNAVSFTLLISVVLHRFGLVATTMLLFVDNVVSDIPLTTDLTVWWSTPTILTVAMLAALVSFAYSAARTGEPLFGKVLAE
jgi:serine/threonine-protein kinase